MKDDFMAERYIIEEVNIFPTKIEIFLLVTISMCHMKDSNQSSLLQQLSERISSLQIHTFCWYYRLPSFYSFSALVLQASGSNSGDGRDGMDKRSERHVIEDELPFSQLILKFL
ncbi:hypothetical protein CEXT_759201 [Caerostris extrusa]|uniref:Uncharacterized protein n=1 Tax=Caerostris extrusa TaxID=172846 RepID=A0AAV4XUE5_CAEEX|nr:hypothetical protein CEXT_759201 [Caerostris extrusa]